MLPFCDSTRKNYYYIERLEGSTQHHYIFIFPFLSFPSYCYCSFPTPSQPHPSIRVCSPVDGQQHTHIGHRILHAPRGCCPPGKPSHKCAQLREIRLSESRIRHLNFIALLVLGAVETKDSAIKGPPDDNFSTVALDLKERLGRQRAGRGKDIEGAQRAAAKFEQRSAQRLALKLW